MTEESKSADGLTCIISMANVIKLIEEHVEEKYSMHNVTIEWFHDHIKIKGTSESQYIHSSFKDIREGN